MKKRDARGTAAVLAARVPEAATLYIFQTKDEGIMFYYGRRVVRLAGPSQLPSATKPLYCILNANEWQHWDPARPIDWSRHLTDAQGDPLILVRLQKRGQAPF
jgi:hypothetical protein